MILVHSMAYQLIISFIFVFIFEFLQFLLWENKVLCFMCCYGYYGGLIKTKQTNKFHLLK